MKAFWEYPVTFAFTVFIFLLYPTVLIFVPLPYIHKYFYATPGYFSPINWLLSIFFHNSPEHLLGNLLVLFLVGRVVEEKVGGLRWVLFFFLAGFFSVIADSFIRYFIYGDYSPVAGASGAIAGLIAIAALLSPLHIHIMGKKILFPVFALLWFLAYSDVKNLHRDDRVAHWAHLAGFLSCFLTAYFLNAKQREELKNGFLINIVFFTLTMVLLYLLRNR
ncbi:MAG: rhomboid family intramembrane serine protease [Spirochaetota bacterium]